MNIFKINHSILCAFKFWRRLKYDFNDDSLMFS